MRQKDRNPYGALMPKSKNVNTRAKPPPTMGEFNMISKQKSSDSGEWTTVKKDTSRKKPKLLKLGPGRFRGKVVKVMERHAFLQPEKGPKGEWHFFKYFGLRHRQQGMPAVGDLVEYSMGTNEDPGKHKGKKIATDIVNLSNPLPEDPPEEKVQKPAQEEKLDDSWSTGQAWHRGWAEMNQGKHRMEVAANSAAVEITTGFAKPSVNQIGAHFSQFGRVKDVQLGTRGDLNRALVKFGSKASATKALMAGCFQSVSGSQVWVMSEGKDAPPDLGSMQKMLRCIKQYLSGKGQMEAGRISSYIKDQYNKIPKDICGPHIRLKDIFIRETGFQCSYRKNSALFVSVAENDAAVAKREQVKADHHSAQELNKGWTGTPTHTTAGGCSAPVRGSARMKFRGGGRGGRGRGRGGHRAQGEIDPLYRPEMATMPKEFKNKRYVGRVTTFNIGCGGFILSNEFNQDCPGLAKDGKIFIYRHHLPKGTNKLFPDQWLQFYAYLKHDNIYHARDVHILNQNNPSDAALIVVEAQMVKGPGDHSAGHGWQEQWEEKLKMFLVDQKEITPHMGILDEETMAGGLGGAMDDHRVGYDRKNDFHAVDPANVKTKNLVDIQPSLARTVSDPMMDAFNVNSYAQPKQADLSKPPSDPMMDAFNVSSYAPPRPPPAQGRPPPNLGRPPPGSQGQSYRERAQPPPRPRDHNEFPALGAEYTERPPPGYKAPPPAGPPPKRGFNANGPPQGFNGSGTGQNFNGPGMGQNRNGPPGPGMSQNYPPQQNFNGPGRGQSYPPQAAQWRPAGSPPAPFPQQSPPPRGPQRSPNVGQQAGRPHAKDYTVRSSFALFVAPGSHAHDNIAKPVMLMDEGETLEADWISEDGKWVRVANDANGRWAPIILGATVVLEEVSLAHEGEVAPKAKGGEGAPQEGPGTGWRGQSARQLDAAGVKRLSVPEVERALEGLNLSALGKEGELRQRLCDHLGLDYHATAEYVVGGENRAQGSSISWRPVAPLEGLDDDQACLAALAALDAPSPAVLSPGPVWKGGSPPGLNAKAPMFVPASQRSVAAPHAPLPTALELYDRHIVPLFAQYPQYAPSDWDWKTHLRPHLKQTVGPEMWSLLRAQKVDKQVKSINAVRVIQGMANSGPVLPGQG